jgi:hypothetical protein
MMQGWLGVAIKRRISFPTESDWAEMGCGSGDEMGVEGLM